MKKEEYESASEHGYYVQSSSISNKELSSGNLKKLQLVDEEIQKYAQSKES